MGFAHRCPTSLVAENNTAGAVSLYLPQFSRLGERANKLALENEEAEENGGEHGLTVQDICNAYSEVLTAIRSSTTDQEISESLLAFIDGSFVEVERHPDFRDRTVFDRSLRRFRALSAVSLQCGSSRLGRVMHDFFHPVANYVTTSMPVPTIILWAYAIHASCMLRHEKKSCLEIIVRHRPEVIHRTDSLANLDPWATTSVDPKGTRTVRSESTLPSLSHRPHYRGTCHV